MASGDAITKRIAGDYEAPQLFAMSGFLVVLFTVASAFLHRGQGPRGFALLRTPMPGAMALRALFTVLASIGFFYAFRLLPLADVFFFMAMMPLVAAFLSGPLLGEPVRPISWVALSVGICGVLFILPDGPHHFLEGHLWAIFAGFTGTLSILLSRKISQVERCDLAQVFYPNFALFAVMAVALPFYWVPISLHDLLWVIAYAAILFVGRSLIVVAMRLVPAVVAMPMLNIQFVWMVLIGYLAFQETPSSATFLGVGLVILSGIALVLDEHLPERRKKPSGVKT
jgi:S-adenosylmethionine uptake transporter